MIKSFLSTFVRSLGAVVVVAALSPLLLAQACDPNTQDCPPPPSCVCPSGQPAWLWTYTVAISTAMDAESATITLIATLPVPLPKPAAAALLGIADDFSQIQTLVATARSLSLRATMPIPLPAPAGLPMPPPRVLAGQAKQTKEHAVQIAASMDKKLAATGAQASLGPIVADLKSRISDLPTPIP